MPLAAVAVPAIIGAGIGAASDIYSASQDREAASKANAAQQQAAQQQLQLQREQFDRVEGLNQPFIQGGYAGFDALLSRLGVQPGMAGQPQVRPANGNVGAPQAAPQPNNGAPGPDFNGYLAANPDVAQWAQQAVAQGAYASPEEAAQFHYQQYGQTEGRQLPQTPAQAPTAPEAVQADPNAPPDYMNMARPDAPAAPEFMRPEAMQFQDYGQGPQFSWDPSQIANDPGFKFETGEAAKGVNANFAARGKVRSGAAATALQDRLFGVAHTYGNDYFSRALQGYGANRSAFQDNRNYGTGLTQYQQGRADNVFGDDRAYDTARWQDQRTYGDARFDAERNYQTNRYDTGTDNLFRLTGIGLTGAGNVSGAGAAYANNAGNIFGNQADSTAAAAQQRAGANAGLAGSIGGAAANIFANWGGGVRTPAAAPNAGGWTGQMGNWGF